jgi:hypothetical protein
MYYVCIENNNVSSILSYQPAVPNSITVETITDDDYNKIMEQTHRFDVATRTVVLVDASITSAKIREQANGIEREFLNSTDWKILRHMRQLALNINTSLTAEEYLALEAQRNAAASRIV